MAGEPVARRQLSQHNSTFRTSRVGQNRLDGVRVAILVADDVEKIELAEPRKALGQASARTVLISPKPGKVQGIDIDHDATIPARRDRQPRLQVA